mgnify:CR=1 FL=1
MLNFISPLPIHCVRLNLFDSESNDSVKTSLTPYRIIIAPLSPLLIEELQKSMMVFLNASCLVGHNVEFDKHIVGAELLRIGDEDIISFMTSICTMMSSIDYCKIINHYGYKYPQITGII